MSVDSPAQLAGLKRAGALVAATLRMLRSDVAPGSRSAHAEHTVMVGRNGPVILTA